jgi:glycosyltransferase involved in cell wall biosynthesis
MTAAAAGVGDLVHYAPALPVEQMAALVAGARAVVHPVVSDAAGLSVLDALAAGAPVIATVVGALPEVIGPAGLLVEPRDPDRLAAALRAAWADEAVHRGIARAAARAAENRRTWADVAVATRAVYAEDAGGSGGGPALLRAPAEATS